MKLEEKIEKLLEAPLVSRGYELVRVKIIGGKRLIVAIDIERSDFKPVTVDDCVKANEVISALLDVEDFIKGRYTLEVSSPGEVRPLTKIKDFQRFCGKVSKIELFDPIDGMKKFSGKIKEVCEPSNSVTVVVANGDNVIDLEIPLSNVRRANVKREF